MILLEDPRKTLRNRWFDDYPAELRGHPWVQPFIVGSKVQTLLHDQRIEEALVLLSEVTDDGTDGAMSNFQRATCLLTLDDYKQGFHYFEDRSTNQFPMDWMWDGEPTDEPICIRHEGGLGDTIMMARFMPQVLKIAPQAFLGVHQVLVDLFADYPVRDLTASDPPSGDHLFRINDPPGIKLLPIMSLPYLLNLEFEDIKGIPYLYPHDPGPRLNKIGFCWTGSPTLRRYIRDIPDDIAIPFAEKHDLLRAPFHAPGDDYMATANKIWGLDLLITVDVSIAHLAGAMGIPTWVLLSLDVDWRWGLKRSTTPWYNSVRLFRCTKHDDWPALLDEVGAALEARR